MTIRECSMQICRENGMSEEELARFLKDQDEHASPDNLLEVNTQHIEDLGANEPLFWDAIRCDLPILIKRWRDATSQTSLNE